MPCINAEFRWPVTQKVGAIAENSHMSCKHYVVMCVDEKLQPNPFSFEELVKTIRWRPKLSYNLDVDKMTTPVTTH